LAEEDMLSRGATHLPLMSKGEKKIRGMQIGGAMIARGT